MSVAEYEWGNFPTVLLPCKLDKDFSLIYVFELDSKVGEYTQIKQGFKCSVVNLQNM